MPIRSKSPYVLTQWLLLRGISFVYLVAFLSVLVQLDGLLGSNGILPANAFLAKVSASVATEKLWMFPSLFWLNASDLALFGICILGAIAALLAFFSVIEGLSFLVSWICWLSFVSVGQDFLSFQWDVLLLESGFLAILLAPWQVFGQPWKFARTIEPNTKLANVVIWLFRWLLFRLMFMSGIVKIMSGDVAWRSLTALKYHYQTQPLPTPAAWLANQLPDGFQAFSAVAVFFIELVVPFLMLCPRRARFVAAFFTLLLQSTIALTGNYTFFNLLTAILCVSLLDDTVLRCVIPGAFADRLSLCTIDESATGGAKPKTGVRTVGAIVVAVFIIFVSGEQFAEMFMGAPLGGREISRIAGLVEPFHITNTYGLFAVMTTTRPEITVEGSLDGTNWRQYIFKFKPGPLDRPPPVVAPYQPRLDWQMWFAALGSAQENPWFASFMQRLLDASPAVLRLLEVDPFHGEPPKFVRATTSLYSFTSIDEKSKTGNWWKSGTSQPYFGPVSAEDY